MTIKFASFEEARAALDAGDVSPSDILDTQSAIFFRAALEDALAELPADQTATLCQIEYGQWLVGAIQTLDCDFGS